MNIAEHLERYLGEMEGGWSSTSVARVQVCRFEDTPRTGVDTLATLGVSNEILAMPRGRSVRQELLFAYHRDLASDDLIKLLHHVADLVLRRGHALLRGEVLPLGGRVDARGAAESLYVAMPVLHPEGLATLLDSTPPTVVAWLVPVAPPEVALVSGTGWEALEDLFETSDVDLFDLRRRSVV